MLNQIQSNNAPKAIGPYSQAIKTGGLIFCSGQLGVDPKSGELLGIDVSSQTRQALKNLSAVLSAAGADLSQVVRADVFLKNLADFKTFNEVYESFFPNPPFPARQTVEVSALPKGALVEISCIAILASS